MAKRVILLVLDGLGAGAMPDAASFRAVDADAFTLRSLVQACGPLAIPNLQALGIGAAAPGAGVPVPASPAGAFGRALLAHWGADTYAGHNEIQGARPLRPESILFEVVAPAMTAALTAAGFHVRKAIDGGSALLVDDAVLVGDNVESDPGRIYNVTGALADTPFAKILAIGTVVRQVARTSRVIALGGTGIRVQDILAHTVTNAAGQTGVITPDLHIYNESYQVRHLGFGIRAEFQAPARALAGGLPVSLIGKMADVIECPGAVFKSCVQTEETMATLLQAMAEQSEGFLSCTVQETDLAGHEEDPIKYARILALADQGIGEVRARLEPGDVFIIMADHGNDPLIGHRFHTREQVPLLVTGPEVAHVDLGVRSTMADVAATVCDLLHVEAPESGSSFAHMFAAR